MTADLLRLLLAASASDADDVVGRAGRRLRDAGHEAVLLGEVSSTVLREAVAVQEDVDATVVWTGTSLEVTGDDSAVREGLSELLAGLAGK